MADEQGTSRRVTGQVALRRACTGPPPVILAALRTGFLRVHRTARQTHKLTLDRGAGTRAGTRACRVGNRADAWRLASSTADEDRVRFSHPVRPQWDRRASCVVCPAAIAAAYF